MKKNTRSADLFADQIDVMTNFAVKTNAVIKRVQCIVHLRTTSVPRTEVSFAVGESNLEEVESYK